jgi:serine/threonine-protein kinase
VSESRQQPPPPPLQRPITSPAPISTPALPPQGAHPTPPVAAPSPAPQGPPQGPPPGYPAAAPAPSPFSSQVIPQSFTQTGPHYPGPPVAPPNAPPPPVPPPPQSSPSMSRVGATGTIPAIPTPAAAAPIPTPGPQPVPPHLASRVSFSTTQTSAQLPRITVQYPQVGSTLTSPRGSYVVRDVIGAGEFGAVYEAIGPFDQIYAVKMVRPANRPYSEVQAEWAREQSRLFSLRHPNVVYIYDSFEQGHLFYLALERCDHALKAMLGTPMTEGLVIELTRQMLAAVQFLHDNDVIHDDLHAGNVLITHTDRPTVKISDFGISHELRGMPAVRPNVVHHAIMAPEILASGYTSRQSDLYQVGLLMYWMLVGEPAIQMEVPYQELVRQVGDGEPRKRAEALGTPLGSLIAKMLRRREAFRYTSAREVWGDLRELPAWKQRHLFPAK